MKTKKNNDKEAEKKVFIYGIISNISGPSVTNFGTKWSAELDNGTRPQQRRTFGSPFRSYRSKTALCIILKIMIFLGKLFYISGSADAFADYICGCDKDLAECMGQHHSSYRFRNMLASCEKEKPDL